MTRVTVLTLNVHMGFSLSRRRFILPELREAIRATDADIACLQEVMGENQLHRQRVAGWPDHPQYEYLADSLWPEFAYGRNAAYPHGHHGNALLSRFPIGFQRNHDISIDGHEGRGLLHCGLDVPGREDRLHVICTHLGLRESHRRRQIDRLIETITTLPATAPLILAGDFNDWRLHAHARLRAAGLTEAFELQTGALARTFPSRWPLLRVDRIYLRGARVVSTERLSMRPWSRLSDHAALLATLALDDPP